jgi:hypothetical protein
MLFLFRTGGGQGLAAGQHSFDPHDRIQAELAKEFGLFFALGQTGWCCKWQLFIERVSGYNHEAGLLLLANAWRIWRILFVELFA